MDTPTTIKNLGFPKVSSFAPSKYASSNHFLIKTQTAEIFQSYDLTIAVKDFSQKVEQIILDRTHWNKPITGLSDYRNKFLGETSSTTKKKIEQGVYTLANLNN